MQRAFVSLAILCASLPAFGADWNPKLAAQYLDGREKAWFAWPTAKATGGPCLSCHTGMTYLFARPALRRALGESEPTQYETGLLDGLRARVPQTKPSSATPRATQALGVESIFAALFVGAKDPAAFERLWSLQRPDGAWAWFNLDLNPWELNSDYFGATLAAMAAGTAGIDPPQMRALRSYLNEERSKQALQNRLMLLWASTKTPDLLSNKDRSDLIAEVLKLQQADGGWTLDSLGPWQPHAAAIPSVGSNGYATGFTAFVIEEAGVPASDVRVQRALNWLRSHQDPQTGAWESHSMNKQFKPGSMQESFMKDSATAFAAMALLKADSVENGQR